MELTCLLCVVGQLLYPLHPLHSLIELILQGNDDIGRLLRRHKADDLLSRLFMLHNNNRLNSHFNSVVCTNALREGASEAMAAEGVKGEEEEPHISKLCLPLA